MCRDGSRNGLRRTDIQSGADPCIDGPYDIDGVVLGRRRGGGSHAPRPRPGNPAAPIPSVSAPPTSSSSRRWDRAPPARCFCGRVPVRSTSCAWAGPPDGFACCGTSRRHRLAGPLNGRPGVPRPGRGGRARDEGRHCALTGASVFGRDSWSRSCRSSGGECWWAGRRSCGRGASGPLGSRGPIFRGDVPLAPAAG